jgi:WXG100 family type VII secretion target
MAKISVSPEELETEANAVKKQATEALQNFEALKSRLSGLTNVFTGKAQVAFDGKYQEWNTHAKGLTESLDALGKFLETSAKTLRETDEQLASGLG